MPHTSPRLARPLAAIAAALAAFALPAGAALAEPAPLPVQQLAGALPEAGELHMALLNNGERDGFMRLGWQRDGDELVIYDRTMLPSQEIYETLESGSSADDLGFGHVSIRFHAGNAINRVDVRAEDGRVVGMLASVRPGAAVRTLAMDAPLPDDAILRASVFILPLVLPQQAGLEWRHHWVEPLSAREPVAEFALTAAGPVSIDTPSGPLATFKYELRGVNPSNDIYVTTGPTPEIARIDVIGSPLRFVRMIDAEGR